MAIAERCPSRLRLPHFGVIADHREHLDRMRSQLATWAERVRTGMTADAFEAAAAAELRAGSDPENGEAYVQAAPFRQSHAGLERYWRKRAERAD